MRVYSLMVNNIYYSEDEAIKEFKDYVNSGLLAEEDPVEQDICYGRFIEELEGFELHYDYGADYYFIADE